MIDLVDVIRDLRIQISQAQLASASEDLQFELGPIELEMSVAVTTEVSGQAKVRFYVLDVGAGAKDAEVSTQRIKVTLTPRAVKPGDAADAESEAEKVLEQIYVTGKELAGER